MDHKPNVLFLCTGNSARSQMAEGLLRHRAGDQYNALSAGTSPKTLNPLAVQVMNEIGIDISQQRSKDLVEFLGKVAIPHLVVVCGNAAETCPRVWPGVMTREFWNLDDPAAATGSEEVRLDVFRESRDEIDRRIRNWLRDHHADAAFSQADATQR